MAVVDCIRNECYYNRLTPYGGKCVRKKARLDRDGVCINFRKDVV